jgi:hypothetical protein
MANRGEKMPDQTGPYAFRGTQPHQKRRGENQNDPEQGKGQNDGIGHDIDSRSMTGENEFFRVFFHQ